MSIRDKYFVALIILWLGAAVLFCAGVALNRYGQDQWDHRVREKILDARQ